MIYEKTMKSILIIQNITFCSFSMTIRYCKRRFKPASYDSQNIIKVSHTFAVLIIFDDDLLMLAMLTKLSKLIIFLAIDD